MTREELLEEIDRERKWLDEAGYNAYNIDVVFTSIIKKVKEQEPVLDKIRAEILDDWQIKKFPSSPFSCGLKHAIEIIDKYRKEKE